MPKGHTNNPNGRPKGSKNRDKLRATIEKICRENADNIKHDLELLEPKDRLIVLTRLLTFILPKPEADEPDTLIQSGEIEFKF